MQRAQATWLPDGRRLHLHHGPIDMIVEVNGPGRRAAFKRAAARFDSLLDELAAELPRLRAPTGAEVQGDVAQRMARVTTAYAPDFITPMAAVAGAGADAVLEAACEGPGITKAYVNNGGDVAFYLSDGRQMQVAVATDPPGQICVTHNDAVRGIATSGWRGRSHSFGIADSVTVLAATAAQADAGATMIANAIDLPGHPNICRERADSLAPDSDLGARLVTTDVAPLRVEDINTALTSGEVFTTMCQTRGLITGAVLVLQGQIRLIGPLSLLQQKDPMYA